MSITTDPHYDSLCHLIQDFADEVDVQKSVVERSYDDDEHVCVMCVFYASPAQKDYLVVLSHQESFAETLPHISEALHLFSARNCYSVLVTIASKIAIDGTVYDSINFFVAAQSSAFIYYLPYTVNRDGDHPTIIWHDDLSYIGELATADMDQNGSDFVNILHAHVNVDQAPFEASEILNYLSYHGFAIQALNENNVAAYIDMSTFEYTSNT